MMCTRARGCKSVQGGKTARCLSCADDLYGAMLDNNEDQVEASQMEDEIADSQQKKNRLVCLTCGLICHFLVLHKRENCVASWSSPLRKSASNRDKLSNIIDDNSGYLKESMQCLHETRLLLWERHGQHAWPCKC